MSKLLECTTQLRWVYREEPVYQQQNSQGDMKMVGSREAMVLQQAWKNMNTDETEWRDVPIVDELNYEIVDE